MKEFIKLEEFGQLYIDRVLFESYFPIIFTCVNENKDIFICVCCQNNEKRCKWLIGKTDGMSIVRLLRDEITLRQLLLNFSSGRISVDYVENEYSASCNNSDWVEDSVYLPKADSYMFAEDGEFDDEIIYFASMGLRYDEIYHNCAKQEFKVARNAPDSMGESYPADTFAVGDVVIQSEVISTREVIKKMSVGHINYIEENIFQKIFRSIFTNDISVSIEDKEIKVKVDDLNYADAA